MLLIESGCVINDVRKLLLSLIVNDGLGDRRADTGDDCKIEPLVNDSPWLKIIGSVATINTSSADFFLSIKCDVIYTYSDKQCERN